MQENNDPTEHRNHGPECIGCTEGPAALDAQLDLLIRENGFGIAGVLDTDPPFAYTVGLTARGLPELMLAGNFTEEQFNMLVANVALEMIANAPDVAITVPTPDCPAPVTEEIIRATALVTENSHDFHIMIRGEKPDDSVPAKLGMRVIKPIYHEMLLGKVLQRYGAGISCVQIFIPDAYGKLPWESGFWVPWGLAVQQIPLYIDPAETEADPETTLL